MNEAQGGKSEWRVRGNLKRQWEQHLTELFLLPATLFSLIWTDLQLSVLDHFSFTLDTYSFHLALSLTLPCSQTQLTLTISLPLSLLSGLLKAPGLLYQYLY